MHGQPHTMNQMSRIINKMGGQHQQQQMGGKPSAKEGGGNRPPPKPQPQGKKKPDSPDVVRDCLRRRPRNFGEHIRRMKRRCSALLSSSFLLLKHPS